MKPIGGFHRSRAHSFVVRPRSLAKSRSRIAANVARVIALADVASVHADRIDLRKRNSEQKWEATHQSTGDAYSANESKTFELCWTRLYNHKNYTKIAWTCYAEVESYRSRLSGPGLSGRKVSRTRCKQISMLHMSSECYRIPACLTEQTIPVG